MPDRISAAELAEALGKAEKRGGDWYALCPAHEDTHPSLRLRDGQKGVVWYCGAGCSQDDVLAGLKDRGLLGRRDDSRPSKPQNATPKTSSRLQSQTSAATDTPDKAEWVPIVPIPADAPRPPAQHPKLGRIAAWWAYRTPERQTIGFICRFDPPDGKQILPLTYCERDGKRAWQWKSFPKPRPLYGLDKLHSRPSDPVLIVEGEKCADAAQKALPTLVSVAWPGGSSAIPHCDLSPLAGRDLIVWPDADDAGHKAAREIAERFPDARIVPLRDDLPKGWDVADAVEAGWSRQRLRSLLRLAEPLSGFPESEPGDDEPPEPPPPPSAQAAKPEIVIAGGELPRMVDMAESAVLEHSDHHGLYQRGGQIVRVIRLPAAEEGSIRRAAGTPIIRGVADVSLVETFTQAAHWLKWDARSDSYIRKDCPDKVASVYSARAGSWRLRPLSGVIDTPTLRADGSILSMPGYDPTTGLLFLPDREWPSIPEKPGREEATEALMELKYPFRHFPWVKDEHRSVFLSCLLTSIVRKSLGPVPMFAFSAPTPGTGKSKLADSVSMIAMGRKAPAMSMKKDEAETSKALFSSLLAGDHILAIDNIERDIEGSMLCSLLTQDTIQDRILGEHRNVTVPTNLTVMATGNNLTFKGDMRRRALICVIDAGMERPDTRRFEGDLLADLRQQRARMVVAALTVLRAYALAGWPKQDLEPYGDFTAWSEWVRAAMVWLGEADPVRTRDEISSADPVNAQLSALLSAWHNRYGVAKSVSVKDALSEPDAAERAGNESISEIHRAIFGAAFEIAGEGKDRINTRRLGWFLRRNSGRILDGLRFEQGPDMLGRQTWRVVSSQNVGAGDD